MSDNAPKHFAKTADGEERVEAEPLSEELIETRLLVTGPLPTEVLERNTPTEQLPKARPAQSADVLDEGPQAGESTDGDPLLAGPSPEPLVDEQYELDVLDSDASTEADTEANATSKRSNRLKHAIIALIIALAVGIPGGILGFTYFDLNGAVAQATGHIEYAQQANQQPGDVVTCTSDRAKVEVEGGVDATKVGVQELPVRIVEGPFSKESTVSVPVKDTQPPVITPKAESVTVTIGNKPAAADVVSSVADPVDGALEAANAEPEARGKKAGEEVFYDKGWYVVGMPESTDKSGSYKITVTACDRHGNKATKDVELKVVDPLEGVTLTPKGEAIEYAKEPVDPAGLVTCSVEGAKVEADKLDVSSVGKKSVTFKVSKENSTHEVACEFTVHDTKKPVITPASDAVTISLGNTPKATDVVKSVVDPVDGALELVEMAPQSRGTKVGEEVFYDKGWYMVEGIKDATKVGSYKATVTAYDKHGNKETKEIAFKVADPLEGVTLTPKTDVLEYSSKPVDPVTLVTCSDANAKVEASALDVSSVGEKTVTYKLSKDKSTREVTQKFTVRDTKKPSIVLNAEACSVEKGAGFDPYGNVKSVTDEVDGQFARVDAVPATNGNGWYTVTGSFDVNTVGKYSLKVVACDKNGNRAEKEFSLEVKEPSAIVVT